MHTPLRALAFAVFCVTAGGCAGGQRSVTATATPSASATVTPMASATESAAPNAAPSAPSAGGTEMRAGLFGPPPAMPSAPPATIEQVRSCDEACVVGESAAIAATLEDANRTISDRPVYAARLRTMRAPVAHAWAALLAHRFDAARETFTAEIALLEQMQLLDPAPPRADNADDARLLRAIRMLVDGNGDLTREQTAALTPCWIFPYWGADAVHAFDAAHGSNMDALGRETKRRCVELLVRGSMSEPVARAGLEAQTAIAHAAFTLLPRPETGTMYTALTIAATDVLYDAFLDPRTVPEHGGDADVTEAIAHAPRRLGPLRARLPAWRRAVSAQEPALAAALCNAGPSPMPAMSVCTARAHAVINSTLASWVRSMTNDG